MLMCAGATVRVCVHTQACVRACVHMRMLRKISKDKILHLINTL